MAEPRIKLANKRGMTLEVTPIGAPKALATPLRGVPAAEAMAFDSTSLYSGYVRPAFVNQNMCLTSDLSIDELIQFEYDLRSAALGGNSQLLLGLYSEPAIERSSGVLDVIGGGIKGAGLYQLMQFPIARINGISLPAGSRVSFSDPSRWFQGGMESRLFTVSVQNTNKFFAWDAHAPVGKTPHDFFHVNQKGMLSTFGETNHAGLSGAALVQAKQLRYLKIGGRIFLIVGVIVDTAQMVSAGVQSYQQGSAKPVAAQAVRIGAGWALAWAGAKAGVAFGAAVGVETGPGVVLTAIGGGLIGGIAGYFGGDWVADFIYED